LKIATIRPNKKSLVILGAVAAVLLVALCTSYYVLSTELQKATGELESKAKMVDDSKKIAARLVEVEQNLLDAKMELSDLEVAVASHAYIPTLLEQIEQLGNTTSLRVYSVRPAPKEAPQPIKKASENSEQSNNGASQNNEHQQAAKPKPYEELKIDIEAEGKYFEIRNFMFHLTRFPKIVGVNTVQLSPTGVSRGFHSPDLQARFNITAYIFPETQPNTKNKQPTIATPASASRVSRRSNDAG